MSTLKIDVRSLAGSLTDAVQAMETGHAQPPRYSFSSAQALMRTLGGKRFDLIQALAGAGAVTIREAARRVDRDVKAVHGDVQVLLACGVLDKTADGKIEFPYDAVHVDFLLKAA
ncbi:DNA-binding protein [Polaromonas sp. C04]|uniref:HVO_A0114 family putative DNA-binding protein n=1 Tax=Polaromonas sp. C04 TaxID=1945857 RepID=UPI0009878E99|nr:DNA-binding protein [Polaromonas sp. C04]OOG54873.1 DNA-binding protein [Polaromonas sp. C04]